MPLPLSPRKSFHSDGQAFSRQLHSSQVIGSSFEPESFPGDVHPVCRRQCDNLEKVARGPGTREETPGARGRLASAQCRSAPGGCPWVPPRERPPAAGKSEGSLKEPRVLTLGVNEAAPSNPFLHQTSSENESELSLECLETGGKDGTLTTLRTAAKYYQ